MRSSAVLGEVVAAGVGVDLSGGKEMRGDDQDRMADCDGGPARFAPSPEPGVLGGEVGVFGSAGGVGRLDERDLQPFRALTGPPGVVLAGGLVSWAHARPGCQVSGGGETVKGP